MNNDQEQLPAKSQASKGVTTTDIQGESTDPDVAKYIHINVMTSAVHTNGLAHRIEPMINGVDIGQTSDGFVEHVFNGMNPRDPVEEMLVSQIVLAHTRAMHLADMAMSQTKLDQIRIINEYADKAANTYRRLMLSLDEYRRPRRGGDTYTQIKQANIANQQIVDNREISNGKNRANEQRCERAGGEACVPIDTIGA